MAIREIYMFKTLPAPRRRFMWWGLFFAIPALVMLLLFNIYPMLYAFFISLFRWDMLTPPRYVGLGNFESLFQDRVFWISVRVTAHYVFFTVVPVWFLSLGAALLLNQIRFLGVFSGFFKSMYFLPNVILIVSACLIWKLLLNNRGPINGLLSSLGLPTVNWLTSPDAAPWSIILMSWWHATGYYMIIFLAGLQGISRHYYEAASIDGANAWQRFRYITTPLLRPTMLLVVVLSVINGLRTFAPQRILTNGGPANSTRIVTMYIYQQGFEFLQMGIAAAASLVLFAFVLVFTIVQLWMFGAFRDE
jgi:multiple sugar transport system permease protein